MPTALVLGLGDSGLAMARWLAAAGHDVRVADTRSAPPRFEDLQREAPKAEFVGGDWPSTLLDGVDLVALSPGLSPERKPLSPLLGEARKRKLDVVGEIELFARELARLRADRGYAPQVIGITGTNGKTTTTRLTGLLVERSGRRVAVAGNIGPTALDELRARLAADALPEVWVLELSSFQLATTTSLHCSAATVLNITQDHLDWHGSMDAYSASKQRIFAKETVQILNRDDPRVMAMARKGARVITVGSDAPAAHDSFGLLETHGMTWLAAIDADDAPQRRRKAVVAAEPVVEIPPARHLMPVDALLIRGRHNALNALVALALARAIDCPLAPMLHALREYRGEPHRVEPICVLGEVEYFDDSKGTNVGASVAALDGLGGEGRKLVVILGGDGKGQDFTPLAPSVARYARAVVLIGRDAAAIRAALTAGAPGVPLFDATTLEEAVQQASGLARSGDAVLLSPACASLDMFRDYKHRAQVFVDAVHELAAEAGATMLKRGRSWFDWFRPSDRGSRAFDPTRSAMALAGLGGVVVTSQGSSQLPRFDRAFAGVVLALVLVGTVMVYSASISLADSPRYNVAPTHFLMRHLFSLLVAFCAAAVAFQIPLATWQRFAPWIFVAALVLLVIVLLPGVGKGVNGARRWIPLGPLHIQPSELMKIACVLYAANFTVRKQDTMHDFRKGFLPMAVAMAAIGVLLLLQPDLGAFGVIVAISMGILFLGGVNGKLFAAISAALSAVFVLVIWLSPWRRERIFAYLDPWSEGNALGKAYQLSHSLIAFGRGEWFGVGLGGSVEKLHYLPEAHTDFILAVLGEELGLIAVLTVIVLFYWLVKRAFEIGRQAIAIERTFAGLVAQGIGLWIGVQAFINIGVATGLLPTKGLTLPLMSYGGSALLSTLVALAIVLRVDRENRVLMRGGRA